MVVLVHGGFWRSLYTKTTHERTRQGCAVRGWAAWNIEYRRVGFLGGGGGWPTTLLDVATAIDHLAVIEHGMDSLEWSPAVILQAGSSPCGGSTRTVAGGEPGRRRGGLVRGAVSMSGIVDLEEADRLALGGRHRTLHGRPLQRAIRGYRHASPKALLPLGVPQVLVHAGKTGSYLPHEPRLPGSATNEGDDARYLRVDGIGHGQLIDPSGAGWRKAVSELERLIG